MGGTGATETVVYDVQTLIHSVLECVAAAGFTAGLTLSHTVFMQCR